jgi:citrate lyase subunit beta/citryl-CoA lyase
MNRISLRRSLLYVPGSSLKMIAKSFEVAADAIIFDLEDSVSWQEKENARKNVIEAIGRAGNTGKEIIVRINGVHSPAGIHDILEIVPQAPDAIIVPKADEASIITADTMIGAIEREMGWDINQIQLIPLMETADSIVNASTIVCAASRVRGLQLGAEDLTKELGIVRTSVGDELQYARSVLVFAGRARDIDIIDTPFPDFANTPGLIAETKRVKALGMTGKTCIHPNQVAAVNDLFSPAPEEVVQACRLVEAFELSVKEGKGACTLDGKMIDSPIAERARQIIRKATLIGRGLDGAPSR